MGENCEEMTKVEIGFRTVDEFGQVVETNKSFDVAGYPDGLTLDLLLDEFKLFLLGSGYTQSQVDKIVMVEE